MTAQDVKTFCRTLGLTAVGIASASLPIPPTQGDICPLASGRGVDAMLPAGYYLYVGLSLLSSSRIFAAIRITVIYPCTLTAMIIIQLYTLT